MVDEESINLDEHLLDEKGERDLKGKSFRRNPSHRSGLDEKGRRGTHRLSKDMLPGGK